MSGGVRIQDEVNNEALTMFENHVIALIKECPGASEE
jgi:hypothetical protein